MSFRNLFILFLTLVFIGCNKKEDFQTEKLEEYIPLQIGKYITYRVDSTVFTNFGTVERTRKYRIKHVVDALVADNQGRPSYRIYKYISDSAGTLPWSANGSYFITPLFDQVEKIENNQRIIQMHLPIREGNSWKGNKYLPIEPYGTIYNFSNDDNMEDWDFYFDGPREAEIEIEGQGYMDVYTITHVDESYNVPIVDVSAYAARTFSQEKFSKGIGLVYRNFIMWEYQPNPGGASPYKVGFGIRMWMIDHN